MKIKIRFIGHELLTVGGAFRTMFLHCDMCVKMVEGTIRFCALWPGALI